MKKDVVNSDKICATCGEPIEKNQPYAAVVVDEDWDPTMSAYDLLTKSFRWKTYHSPCPPEPSKLKEKK